ncbi:hypothetical protein HK405_001597, partial [Cladochytrium tenue]
NQPKQMMAADNADSDEQVVPGGTNGARSALRFSHMDLSDPRLQIVNDEKLFS